MSTRPVRSFFLPALSAGLGLMLAGRATAQTVMVLHSFTTPSGARGNGRLGETNSDGDFPQDTLILSGNTLFGTTDSGGTNGNGTVFKVNTDGNGFAILHSFTLLQPYTNSSGSVFQTNVDGAAPVAGLVLSGNTLYGTAPLGGSLGDGTVFAVNTDGTGFTNLYSFSHGQPEAALILSSNILYGTTVSSVFSLNTDGTGFTNLLALLGNSQANLILSGNTLYGTTRYGGTNDQGTVFAVNTDGTGYTNLHSFSPALGALRPFTNGDGYSPEGGLVLSGNTLYGTAFYGGANGDGTVFAVNTDGTGFTNLYTFTARYLASPPYTNNDGANPAAGLILSGNTLYGTASNGGTNNSGVVFTINTDGSDFTSFSFPEIGGQSRDGSDPVGGLILSANTLYGTTAAGGTAFGNAYGTVFSLSLGSTGASQGSLRVTIVPPGAVTAKAQWQVDGGPFQNSGATVSQLSVGSHTLSFKPIARWTTPADQNVQIAAKTVAIATGTYLPADITKPTLTIVTPKRGSRLSSGDLTAAGTAKDNVEVASVFYQLNGGDWTLAGTGNAWKNWSAPGLSLIPGTNIFSAYATDTSATDSKTNTVKFVYLVPAELDVQMVGRGKLTPNDSGKLLAINTSYKMKAMAAPGFAFDSWGGGVPTSTSPTLTFTMSSNLVINVNFRDAARPVNVITFPTVNKKWTNSIITVTGKAHDNVGVSNVWYQINTNGWAEAETFNSFTNWSATNLTVMSGTNLVRAFAVDAAGNVSLTNSIKFKGILP